MRRLINVVVKISVRLGVGGRSTYLLTTIGHRSGVARTTPVNVIEADGERWLVAPYGPVAWVHNARASGQVTLRRGRHTEALRATEVGPDAAGPVLRRYLRQVPVTAAYFDAKRGDPVESFVAEADRHPAFRLDQLTPGR